MIAMARGMMMTDDETRRPSRPPSLLVYESKASGMTTSHTRSKSKLANVHVRGTTVARVDVGAEIVCIRLTVAQLTKGEWECFIALKEGVLFDPLSKGARARRNWHVIPPPARAATAEQAARHYGYTERSVVRMDQQARKLLTQIRERAGLIGDDVRVPIWPLVMNDETLMQWLYSDERTTLEIKVRGLEEGWQR